MKIGPFLRSLNSVPKMMRNLFISLIPIILFSFYKNGIVPYMEGKATIYGMLFPLLFIIIGTLTSFFTEAIYLKFILKKEDVKKSLKYSYAIFPGLFLSLILPINTPILILVLGAMVATIIGKMIYGGFGHNIFNPALIGCLFVITIFGGVIENLGGYKNVLEVDTISLATPLSNQHALETIGNYDTLVKPFGNLLDFFIGTIPGAIGETSALLCIVAYLYLSITRTIKWKIPLVYIGVVFVMTWAIGNMNGLGIWYPIFQVLSGGLMFGAVFMATDPVTSPVTSTGQIIYASLLGILTVTFRFLTPLPEGVLTSILTMNLFVILLDRLGSFGTIAIKKILIPLILCILLGSLITIKLGNKYNNIQDIDKNFNIVSKENIEGKLVYTVTQRGNGGLITSKLTIKDEKVIAFEVLSQNETKDYYKKVEDADYINKLLENQETIEEVDTISGATISSRALKKTIINTLKDLKVKK